MKSKQLGLWLREVQFILPFILVMQVAFIGIMIEAIPTRLLVGTSLLTFFTTTILWWFASFGVLNKHNFAQRISPFLWILYGHVAFVATVLLYFGSITLFRETKSLTDMHHIYITMSVGGSFVLASLLMLIRMHLGAVKNVRRRNPKHIPTT